MTLTITIKNFPSDDKHFNRIKAAILRIWKIDIGRNEKDIVFDLKD